MTAQPSEPVNRAAAPSVNGWSADYLDAMYAQYQSDAGSVPADVRAFMQGFDLGMGRSEGATGGGTAADVHVERVVNAYRRHGHLEATLDPLGSTRRGAETIKAVLDSIPADQYDAPTSTGTTVRATIAAMRAAYCGTTGIEYLHCTTHEEREWFRERFERGVTGPGERADAKEILQHLTTSETFERWLGKRYPGKKRFSLEGAETLIPMLRFMTERGGELGLREVIVGMAHRGRLNVLRHYLGKDTERLITEFEDSWSEGADQGGGDVKYHRGYSFDFATPGGNVHLSMLNNPSHLEAVNALVMGRARARQDGAKEAGRDGRREIAALLIHGDAAVIGQGVVAECVNMSYLEGYHVGGTIHLVVNNQVGFTTDICDDRSSEYCTDLAKVIGAPVLHVNGDDPEACVRAAVMAMEYRQQFGKDVWVDLVCFRRHGHNEQDEPGYTQPAMYATIKAHPGTRAVYAARLAGAGTVSAVQAEAMVEGEIAALDKAQDAAKARPVNPVTPPGEGRWKGFVGSYTFDSPKTAVDAKVISAVCSAMGRVPEGFSVHPKLRGLLESRSNLPTTKKLNHADAEQIAFGTLLWEGTPIRLSGQDSRRGTFTQRHAVLRDEKTGERVTPLNHMKTEQAKLDAWDSPLSEYSVMGFDYGYSRANPHALVLWEGQFGDFCNTAQVVIDQFMASSEVKWDRWAGLVLMLPHGYEGQGPEHSSARLERFLQLCADDNMEVVYPSTGAQLFHMLRRHVKRNFRKPLVVMTPKKFLRVETATIDELSSGEFRCLIDDPHVKDASKVTKVIYCSGKIYHELHERREATKRADLAIVRVEQLYPFHADLARKIDARYPKAAVRVWAQEEPRNQGAFLYAADAFREKVGVSLAFVGRDASASPATGSEYAHKKQQEKILSGAVGPLDGGGQPAKPAAPAPNGSPAKGVVVGKTGGQTVKTGR